MKDNLNWKEKWHGNPSLIGCHITFLHSTDSAVYISCTHTSCIWPFLAWISRTKLDQLHQLCWRYTLSLYWPVSLRQERLFQKSPAFISLLGGISPWSSFKGTLVQFVTGEKGTVCLSPHPSQNLIHDIHGFS